MAKRGKLEIMRDILKLVQESMNMIKPTPLLRRSNLSSKRFQEYFSELLEKGFVREINDKDGKLITLTDKGFKYLEMYGTITSFIEYFDL